MHNKRTYELLNLNTGAKIVLDGSNRNVEPSVDNSDKTWKRSTKDFAFSFEFSKDYKFYQNGASFLRQAYNSDDIEANVQFTEIRYNSNTDIPYNYILGVLDFSEYSTDNVSVSLPVKSGGLRALLKSKRREKLELGVLESLNGNKIDPLITNEFGIINRSIFLSSKLEGDNSQNSFFSIADERNNDFEFAMGSIPLSIKYSSDDKIEAPIVNASSQGGGDSLNFFMYGERSSFVMYNVDRDKTLHLEYNTDFDLQGNNEVFTDIRYDFGISIFKGGANPILDVSNISQLFVNLGALDGVPKDTTKNYNFSGEFELDLKKGDSWCFGVLIRASSAIFADAFITNSKGFLNITETSNINDINRRAKCVLNKNVGEKLMQIITGEKNRYYSEYYNNSDFKHLASATGKWIRGFKDSEYTTSFNDFIENSKCVLNMAHNVEIINGVETVVHEPLRYFFQDSVGITLPNQVNEVKRSVAKEFIFSSITSGYKKPSGDNLYEEVNGLKEISTSNKYIAPVTKIIKDYGIESPYRADSEGKGLTIRKTIEKFPTNDYRTDKNIFNLDLKDVGTGVFAERTWQDDYQTAPYSNNVENTIFEPDTLTGLRLTPFRNMERHFWLLKNAYTKQANKYIRYASTRGNAEIVTQKPNEDAISENGKYKVSDLEQPLFVSQWVEFKHIVTDDISSWLNGTTNVNGREIPNIYFKIGFTNEYGKKEYGYLFELKPDKAGEWKVLKAL